MSCRTTEEYEEAKKIVEALIEYKIISREGDMKSYLNIWDAAFKILDLTK